MIITDGTYFKAGYGYDVAIRFPWENGCAVEVILLNKRGEKVDHWQWIMPKTFYNQYRLFIPTAKKFLDELLKSK